MKKLLDLNLRNENQIDDILPLHEYLSNNLKQRNTNFYYISLFLLAFYIFNIFLLNNCLLQIKNEKEEAFIAGNADKIISIVINDIKLILNSTINNTKTAIISNFNRTKIAYDKKTLGSIIYINEGEEIIAIDMQPLSVLINSILKENFYYKLAYNNKILVSNVQDIKIVNYIKSYQILPDHSFTLSLSYKPNSTYLNKYEKQLKHYIRLISFILAIITIALALGLYQFLKVKINNRKLINNLDINEKAFELNAQYINDCYEIDQQIKSLKATKSQINKIELNSLIEEIKVYIQDYTIKNYYKYKLEIISETKILLVNFDSILMKQIILSLLFNILFFMRGGDHVKLFSIKFGKSTISLTYDSFAAKEEHMNNWSRGLSKHLGNPYILDTIKLFKLITDCGLSYQIIPKQGCNEVIIFLKAEEEVGRVI